MPTSLEWKKKFLSLLLKPSEGPTKRFGGTELDDLADDLRGLKHCSQNWFAAVAATLSIIEDDEEWEHSIWQHFTIYCFSQLMPFLGTGQDQLERLVLKKKLPSDVRARGLMLRKMARCGTEIAWDQFQQTSNYQEIESLHPVLVADALLYTGEKNTALEVMEKHITNNHLNEETLGHYRIRWAGHDPEDMPDCLDFQERLNEILDKGVRPA